MYRVHVLDHLQFANYCNLLCDCVCVSYLFFLQPACVTAVPSAISSRKTNQSFEFNVAAVVFYGVTLLDVLFRNRGLQKNTI